MRSPSLSCRTFTALVIAASCVSLEAQTWRTAGQNTFWSNAVNWGNTLPTQDGTADLLFSLPGNPLLLQGESTLDQNWNIRSLTWNATALANGRVRLRNVGSSISTLTLQAGLNNGSGGRVEIYPDVVLGAAQTWNDTTTPTGSVQFSGPGTVVLGTISGAGGIQKTGSGMLRLGSDANSFAGGTLILGGILDASPGALGTGTVRLDGGTLLSGGTFAKDLILEGAGGTLQTGMMTLTGSISGVGQLRFEPDFDFGRSSGSRFALSGTSTYSGGTVVGVATVNLITTGQSLGTGGVTVKDGGVLGLNAETNLGQKVALKTGGVLVLNSAAINPANIIDSSPANTTGGILSLGVDYGSALDMSAVGNGELFLGSTGSVSYTAATLGAGVGNVYRLGGGSGPTLSPPTVESILTFSGTDNLFTGPRSVVIGSTSTTFHISEARKVSTVIFTRANDYSGGTTLVGGTLGAHHDLALGSGPLTVRSGILETGATVRSIANPIRFAGPPGSQFRVHGSGATLSGGVDLGGVLQKISGGIETVSFSAPISNGALELQSGLWSLSAVNSFSGGFTLGEGGTLDFSHDANLGAAGSALTLRGNLRSTNDWSTARPITIAGLSARLETSGRTVTWTGTAGGSGTLTKAGLGTLILSGGGKNLGNAVIDVEQGTVRFDDVGPNNLALVRVLDGGTFGGNSSAGLVILYAGGRIAPGSDTPGTLRLNDQLNFSGGSIFDFDLGPTLFDKIILPDSGLRSYSSGSYLVNISDTGGLAPGQTYDLIEWAVAPEGTITASKFQLGASPVAGDFTITGNRLRFTTTVPEPGSAALLGVAALMLGGVRRRFP